MKNLTTIIGWAGAASYVIAYILLSLGVVKPDRLNYHLMNAFGGACLVIMAYDLSDMPNFFVNLVWILIATASMARILTARKR